MEALAYPEPIILAIVFLIFLFIFLFKTSNGLPRNWPFLGTSGILLLNLDKPYDTIAEILDRSRGTFLFKGIWFANMDMLATCDPKNLHYITTKNFSNYPKGSHSKELFDVLGISLFNLDFEEWSGYRKILHNYLKRQQFYLNKVIVDNVNEGLIPFLEQVSTQDIVVDMADLVRRHTYDAACFFSTGYKPNTLSIDFPENQFDKAMDAACEAMFSRHVFPAIIWRLQSWLGLGGQKKLSDSKKIVHEIVTNYISMKRQQIKNEGAKRMKGEDYYDALESFLTDYTETAEEFYAEQVVRDNIIGLIFAAYDTTSSTLSWLFWLLSRNPHVEAKIRKEIENCFPVSQGTKWRPSNKEELGKLVYLQAAICETLRLYPAVPLQHRTPVQADVLPSGDHVNPKVRIVMCGYGSGRMKSIWGEDCLEFRPERWINDENGSLKYEKSVIFYTFNAGPRICPGKEMAFTMIKAAAATIIYNYNIQVVETRPPQPKASIILHMKHGMRVRVKRRAQDGSLGDE